MVSRLESLKIFIWLEECSRNQRDRDAHRKCERECCSVGHSVLFIELSGGDGPLFAAQRAFRGVLSDQLEALLKLYSSSGQSCERWQNCRP